MLFLCLFFTRFVITICHFDQREKSSSTNKILFNFNKDLSYRRDDDKAATFQVKIN